MQAWKLIALCALVGGCATTPVPTASAVDVPRDRVMKPELLTARPRTGVLIVKRDEGLGASACNTRVLLNAGLVALIAPGEKVVLHVPEGEHIVGAEAGGICGGSLTEARAVISSQRPVILRVGYSSAGTFSIQPTAF